MPKTLAPEAKQPRSEGLGSRAQPRKDLAFVLVHYRAPERLGKAVREARLQLGGCNRSFEILVLDNSGDAGDLNAEDCRVLCPGSNFGYAAAANLAFRSVRARHLVLSNPDVSMQAGCLGELLQACPVGGVVGPSFYWDSEMRLRLPPTEMHEVSLASRVLARWSPGRVQRWRRLGWRRHAREFWEAKTTTSSYHLSGAMLLFDARALERVGPLDENFRLYFEETDWLRRAREMGVKAVMEPRAVAVHEFDQSAQLETAAPGWFAQSEALFRRRYGLASVRTPSESVEQDLPCWPGEIKVPLNTRELWFEVAATRARFPAAAERLGEVELRQRMSTEGTVAWQPPASVASRVEGWWLTVTGGGGRELSSYRL